MSPTWVDYDGGGDRRTGPAMRAYGRPRCAPPLRIPRVISGGPPWPASAGSSRSRAPSAAAGCSRTAAPDRDILGVELDGSGEVAAVPDDTGGFQRALGPMQFIPSTWERWAADGDGDGVEDPQDVDDAALAAAHYLCSSGEDLATGSGWSAAVYSYNHSNPYVRAVYDASRAYADRTSS